MGIFLKWSDVDTGIQEEMAGQAPSDAKRLNAINKELKNITTKVDIETQVRRSTIAIIPDGTVYDIEDALSLTDMRRVKDIRFNDTSLQKGEYIFKEEDEFDRRIKDDININEYTVYFEEGKQKLRVNSADGETTSTSMILIYYTTSVSMTSAGVLQDLVTSTAGDLILLPERFRDLIILGAMKRLFYAAIGEDDKAQQAITRNRYTSELRKLGLDDTGTQPKTKNRRVKIRI